MVNDFIQYLNTLHSYHGHNSNAFGEKNFTSNYYDRLLVDVPLCSYIVDKMSDDDPKIIMLTGHAGDGKTSLMYQVLKKLNCLFDLKLLIYRLQKPQTIHNSIRFTDYFLMLQEH